MLKKLLSIMLALTLVMSILTSALAAPTPTPKPAAATPKPATPKPTSTPGPRTPQQTAVSTDPNRPFHAHESSYIPNARITFALSQSLWNIIMKDSKRGPFIHIALYKPGASLEDELSSGIADADSKDFDLKNRNTLQLDAPGEPGTYEVIAFDSTYDYFGWEEDANKGAIIARTKVVVRKNALNSFNFRLNKKEYCINENIRVELSGLIEQHTANYDSANIRVYKVGASPDDYELSTTEYAWYFPNDVVYLLGLDEPGNYEVRAYFEVNYPLTDVELVKKIPFTVVNKKLPDGPRAQGGGTFDTTLASKIIGRWSTTSGGYSSNVYESSTGAISWETNFAGYAVTFDPDGSYFQLMFFSGSSDGPVAFVTKGKWRVDKELLYVTDATQSATYLRKPEKDYKDKFIGNEFYNVTIKTDKNTGRLILDTYEVHDVAFHDKYYAVVEE